MLYIHRNSKAEAATSDCFHLVKWLQELLHVNRNWKVEVSTSDCLYLVKWLQVLLYIHRNSKAEASTSDCLHLVKWFQVLLCIANNSVICLHLDRWSKNISNYLIQHTSFTCTQFKCHTVLFAPYIGPIQLLPHRDQRLIAMKGCSTFTEIRRLNIRLFSIICRTLVWEWSYSSTEMQSVYYPALVDLASLVLIWQPI